jgi:copper oxidase (laccase) domain-containing protein
MPFSQQNGLRYYTFEIFPTIISQAVFTRRGGVSPRPWDSLNVGGSIGDDLTHVRENRIRSFKALGRAPESIHDVWQVHSADVVYADAPRPLDTQYQKADILLTDNPQVTLYMRFADCTPILLYDPKKHAIGIVHSGCAALPGPRSKPCKNATPRTRRTSWPRLAPPSAPTITRSVLT